MDPVTIGLLGLSALGGALGGRGGSQTQTTSPTLSPDLNAIQRLLASNMLGRLRNPTALPPTFEPSGVASINNTFANAAAGVQARNQAAGIGGPGAAAPMTALDAGRAGEIARFRSGLPLVERNMRDADVAQALGLLGAGRGSTTTGTANPPGGAAGGALTSLGSILGFMASMGMLRPGATPDMTPVTLPALAGAGGINFTPPIPPLQQSFPLAGAF